MVLKNQLLKFKHAFAKLHCNYQVSVTNIGSSGETLLQRAVRLEKATQVGWILEIGVNPKALPADEKAPCEEFKTLVASIPLAEVLPG